VGRTWKRLLAVTTAGAMLATPLIGEAGQRGRGYARGLHKGASGNPGRGPAARIYQDRASTAGYDVGYDKGLDDGRDGDRYDPVRHREYRTGDRGFQESYGSRDAYANNFRSGFRQGYEDGYRDGTRNRR
jgi:hypothetical protein